MEAQRLEEKGKRSQAGKRSAEDDHRSQKQMRLEDCVPGNSEALEKQIDAAMVDFLAESAVAFRVHVIFFTQAKFLENKIYTEKRQFLPIFCQFLPIYTEICTEKRQFLPIFANFSR